MTIKMSNFIKDNVGCIADQIKEVENNNPHFKISEVVIDRKSIQINMVGIGWGKWGITETRLIKDKKGDKNNA